MYKEHAIAVVTVHYILLTFNSTQNFIYCCPFVFLMNLWQVWSVLVYLKLS